MTHTLFNATESLLAAKRTRPSFFNPEAKSKNVFANYGIDSVSRKFSQM